MTEREQVDRFWPHEDYAIVRKPRQEASSGAPAWPGL
jgi:hypothetical protein